MNRSFIKGQLFTLAVVMAALGVQSASGSCPDYGWPHRMIDSQKDGEFVREVSVSPSHFTWQGYNVEIDESWLAQSGTVHHVFFKLKLNGRSDGESRILRKDGVSIKLQHQDPGEFVPGRGIDSYTWIPLRRAVRFFGGGIYADTIHFVRLETDRPIPKYIKLLVGTQKWAKKAIKDPSPEMSDTVLTFDLKSPSDPKSNDRFSRH